MEEVQRCRCCGGRGVRKLSLSRKRGKNHFFNVPQQATVWLLECKTRPSRDSVAPLNQLWILCRPYGNMLCCIITDMYCTVFHLCDPYVIVLLIWRQRRHIVWTRSRLNDHIKGIKHSSWHIGRNGGASFCHSFCLSMAHTS